MRRPRGPLGGHENWGEETQLGSGGGLERRGLPRLPLSIRHLIPRRIREAAKREADFLELPGTQSNLAGARLVRPWLSL